MMKTLKSLFAMAGGRELPAEDDGPARRTQLAIVSVLATALLAAVWGIGAGSADIGLALGNLYKVPLVIVLSGLFALPVGLLAWNLLGCEYRASDLVVGMTTGMLAGTLVLAVLSPVVALYYQSSVHYSGVIALGACSLALFVGLLVTARTVSRRAKVHRGAWVPVAVMTLVQIGLLIQLISLASPILPESTVFDTGLDVLMGHR